MIFLTRPGSTIRGRLVEALEELGADGIDAGLETLVEKYLPIAEHNARAVDAGEAPHDESDALFECLAIALAREGSS